MTPSESIERLQERREELLAELFDPPKYYHGLAYYWHKLPRIERAIAFHEKRLKEQRQYIDPEYVDIVGRNFWDLLL